MFRGEVHTGDVISYLADGGGGHGDPFQRDPSLVREDVIDGYVSREGARKNYGVALTDELEIDEAGTAKLRASSRD